MHSALQETVMTATGKRPKRMAEELQPGPVVCAALLLLTNRTWRSRQLSMSAVWHRQSRVARSCAHRLSRP
eukprot:jgi/Astpho2/1639/Aster-08275